MRLASLPDAPRRDGRLVVVGDDMATCRPVDDLSLMGWLDAGLDGAGTEARLGAAAPFDPAAALAPLPHARGFLDGSAYVNHVELVRKARGAEMPERFWTDPLMYQGHAGFEPPCAAIPGDPEWGIDLEAEIAIITRDVPMGAAPDEGASLIALVTLINDVSLRSLIPDELSKGFGFVQSKPPCAMAPLAVTPDDLPGWDGRMMHGPLMADVNGAPFGRAEAGEEMTFDFGRLVAHAARTRPLPAGTVVGSGTVSNRDPQGGPGRPVAEGGRGYSCIAEQRMVETITQGAARTPFLAHGDRMRIWMEDAAGRSLFGDIDQQVTAPARREDAT